MAFRDTPWREELVACTTVQDLNALWEKYGSGQAPEISNAVALDLQTRQAELAVEDPPPSNVVQGSMEALERIDTDSFEAQKAYADALNEWAVAHTNFKTVKAKTHLKFKAQEVTTDSGKTVKMANAEAEMHADADDDVAAARLRAYIAEGMVKSTKARMDQLERSFQYHRSLMVNERKLDVRPGS